MMAHPDDAEIFCGGTLIRLAELGWQVHLATAARGDCGSMDLSREEIARIRYDEGVAAAKSIGGTYHCLGLSDLNVIFDANSNRLVIDLFRQVNPSLVITHPRNDYMLDHEQTHLLARSACFAYSVPNASELPLLAGAVTPYLYYADPLEGCDPYTGQWVEPSVLIDISQQIQAKSDMLACHASQREWLREHHGMDHYIHSMQHHGQIRGKLAGCAYAEAFVQHRGHPYPQDDLLSELLGGIHTTDTGEKA